MHMLIIAYNIYHVYLKTCKYVYSMTCRKNKKSQYQMMRKDRIQIKVHNNLIDNKSVKIQGNFPDFKMIILTTQDFIEMYRVWVQESAYQWLH